MVVAKTIEAASKDSVLGTDDFEIELVFSCEADEDSEKVGSGNPSTSAAREPAVPVLRYRRSREGSGHVLDTW